MNILPKKSWNVWSTKNKERVKKDEKEYQQKLDEEKRRQIAIQSLIEDHKQKVNQESVAQQEQEYQQGHINLFKDDDNISESIRSKKLVTNKKATTNTTNQRVEGTFKELDKTPWYSKSSSVDDRDEKKGDGDRRERKKKKREKWLQDKEDPLKMVDKILGKEVRHPSNSFSTSPSYQSDQQPLSSTLPSTYSTSTSNGKKSIEQLRKERLEREGIERKKANELKKSLLPPPPPSFHYSPDKDDRSSSSSSYPKSKYNPQYRHYTGGIVRR
eukprot:gene5227-6507_t